MARRKPRRERSDAGRPSAAAAAPVPRRSPARPDGHAWNSPAALWSMAALVVATAFCYLPSLGNGLTNWDDNLYVTDNPWIHEVNAANLVRVATHPVAFNYHPLTVWSLQA